MEKMIVKGAELYQSPTGCVAVSVNHRGTLTLVVDPEKRDAEETESGQASIGRAIHSGTTQKRDQGNGWDDARQPKEWLREIHGQLNRRRSRAQKQHERWGM